MLRSHPVLLIPAALTLVGFGLSSTPAIAQTTYPFSAEYDLSNTFRPITPDVLEVTISGSTTDAPYGLTQFNGLIYGQIDFTTGRGTFNSDPTVFGLQGLPEGFIGLSGSGNDRVFGTDTATSLIDFTTLAVNASANVTITGGEGRFEGATGQLTLSEIGTFSTDPTVPYRANISVNGSFQTVPEPKTDTTLLSIGAIGAGVLLYRRSRSLGCTYHEQ
jgi:hypothetical protein